MIVHHVTVETADGYLTRRPPDRQAELEYLMELRARGLVIAGGHAPDGARCDFFCRTRQPEDIVRLLESSPLFRHGFSTGHAWRSFAQFLEPWETAPPVPEAPRLVTLVEGAAPDPEMASFALIEARGAGRLVLGGFFAGGESVALMRTGDAAAAVAELEATRCWTAGTLRGRPLVHVL